MLFSEQNTDLKKQLNKITENNRAKHKANVFLKNGIKGCARYIFASLFFKSKREHLSN